MQRRSTAGETGRSGSGAFSGSRFGLWQVAPALVVAVAPGRYPDVLLALVTSRGYQEVAKFDEVIEPLDADFAATRLKTRSVIRLARLVSVDASVVEGRLGAISPSRLIRIRERLIAWLSQ